MFNDIANVATEAFGSFANALGSVVEQWVLTGETGPAVMRKILASALAAIAAESAVRAIFETAKGIAALFLNPAEAGAHFAAAALFASIAGAAALAGRAVAGDAFKKQSNSATGRTSDRSSEDDKPRAIRRESDDAFTSGRQGVFGEPLARLEQRMGEMIQEQRQTTRVLGNFESMPAGEVLVRGASQQRGFIGKTAINEVEKNSGLANRLVRTTRI